MWCQHDFGFIGGSLGCAEGEKLCRAFEHATAQRTPIVVACRTGGARMQEGTMSLMQMAKVSLAVDAHRRAALPFVSVLEDPTYGGVSASFAMQADVRVALPKARIGFAGPDVILNTMFAMDQDKYDAACPADFQSAETAAATRSTRRRARRREAGAGRPRAAGCAARSRCRPAARRARRRDRPPPPTARSSRARRTTSARGASTAQARDVIDALFTDYVELKGDGRVAADLHRGRRRAAAGRAAVRRRRLHEGPLARRDAGAELRHAEPAGTAPRTGLPARRAVRPRS